MEEASLGLVDDAAFKLTELIASCKACSTVDKPLIKYGAYTKWLPERVKVLAIGESPPPGCKETVFYNLGLFDRFRLSMKLVLGLNDDEGILKLFKSKGVFVTGAVKCRPPSRDFLEEMRKRCVSLLRAELELLKPNRVVAMGKTAAASISELLGVKRSFKVDELFELKQGNLHVVFTPHPNYIFRFRRDLAPKLKALLTP